MEISQAALARLYLLACLVGGGLGILYDVLRITRVLLGVQYSRRAAERLQAVRLPLLKGRQKRRESPFLGTVIFFEDLVFGIFCGIVMILLFYGANNGNIRILAIVCALGGFFLYRATLGRTVMLFSEVVAFFAETVIRYACFFALFPFRWIGKRIVLLVGRVVTSVRRRSEKKQRQRFTQAEQKRAEHACGMVPGGKGSLKRGHSYGAEAKKTIQPEHADEDLSRGHRRGLSGRVRKQRHEIQ